MNFDHFAEGDLIMTELELRSLSDIIEDRSVPDDAVVRDSRDPHGWYATAGELRDIVASTKKPADIPPAPNPYDEPIRRLRLAEAPRPSEMSFEAAWKTRRLAEVQATRDALDAEPTAPAPTLRLTSERKMYPAPSGYPSADLDAIRERDAREKRDAQEAGRWPRR